MLTPFSNIDHYYHLNATVNISLTTKKKSSNERVDIPRSGRTMFFFSLFISMVFVHVIIAVLDARWLRERAKKTYHFNLINSSVSNVTYSSVNEVRENAV